MSDNSNFQNVEKSILLLDIVKKIGLRTHNEELINSNHLTPTFGCGFPDQEPTLLLKDGPVSVTNVKKRPRKPLKSRSGYPYHPALLVPEDSKDQVITKTWYIRFYAWDIGKEKLVRKRVLKDDLAEIKDLPSRVNFANKAIESINYFLKNDYHLESKPAKELMDMNFRGYTILNALKFAVNYKDHHVKISEDSLEKYNPLLDSVRSFLKHKELPETYPLRKFNHTFVTEYFSYIREYGELANSTYNYRRGLLHALFEVLMDHDHKLFPKNPIKRVKLLKVDKTKHAAYSEAQLRSIVQLAINRGELHIVLFIQWMYFTLARPEEIINVKIGHINLERRQILFIIDHAKTVEEYVAIPDPLADIIVQSGIMNYPDHYYVFCSDTILSRAEFEGKEVKITGRKDQRTFTPGPHPVGINYFSDKIRGYLEDLKLYEVNPKFTPYSFKHTGAIGLYLATKDVKLVQLQCRHKKLETTIEYLRDLGVFVDYTQINNWKGPFVK